MARVDWIPEEFHRRANESAPNNPKPSGPYTPYNGPPNEFNLTLRKLSAVGLAILLYSAAMPFTPVTWFFAMEGAFFVDGLCAGIVLLSACYFQWRIAGLTNALAISVPNPGGSTIRNGRIEQRSSSTIFVWQSNNHWPYAACEALLLGLAEFGPSEMLRRSIVIGVVAGLWILGWHATPRAYKQWAWEHIKAFWFWIVLSELLNVGRPAVGRRARRY